MTGKAEVSQEFKVIISNCWSNMSNNKPNTNVYYSKCKVRPKILNTKRRNKSRLTLRNYRWTFFSNNIRCISVYTGVHIMCFVFLTIPGTKSHRSRSLPGWPRYIGDRLICKAVKVLPLSPLSCLTCLGWSESLTFQDRLVITEIIDSKHGLGKCLKKNN